MNGGSETICSLSKGGTRTGLLRSCMVLNGQPERCFFQPLSDLPEWLLALTFIVGGIVCVTAAMGMLLATTAAGRGRRAFMEGAARWAGLVGGKECEARSVMFSLIASYSFPSFDIG